MFRKSLCGILILILIAGLLPAQEKKVVTVGLTPADVAELRSVASGARLVEPASEDLAKEIVDERIAGKLS